MSEKIRAQHLARKAILYVRQSSPTQCPTTWKVRRCSTPWKSVCIRSDGATLKLWMRTWEDLVQAS
jgi:hypothetical protein